MRKMMITGLGVALALGLSACSEKAANKVENAGGAIGNDLEHGINNADDHIQSGLDKAGNAIDRAGEKIGAAADNAAAEADRQADKAKQGVGNALERAGQDLKK